MKQVNLSELKWDETQMNMNETPVNLDELRNKLASASVQWHTQMENENDWIGVWMDARLISEKQKRWTPGSRGNQERISTEDDVRL